MFWFSFYPHFLSKAVSEISKPRPCIHTLHRAASSMACASLVCRSQGWIRFLWFYLPNDPCRISSDDMEIRNVLRDNTPSSHSHASPNGNTWKYYAATTKPAILANRDRTSEFGAFDSIPKEGIDRMSGSVEGAIGTDQRACSNGDSTGV
jgi:hypothetical protein